MTTFTTILMIILTATCMLWCLYVFIEILRDRKDETELKIFVAVLVFIAVIVCAFLIVQSMKLLILTI